MKKIAITLIYALLCSLPLQMTAQTNKKKETPFSIKELVERIKGETEIDEARYPALIKEVETRAASCEKAEEAAILHSLIAEMYASFEGTHGWKYRQRSPIIGYIPEDINEWTSTIFKEKIEEEYSLSLQPAQLLQQVPISNYADILEVGKDEALRPTLYDYLIYRALEVNPSDELYRTLIAYKKKANNPKALLLAELDYLSFKNRGSFYNEENKKSYFASLDSLYDQFSSYDFAAEVWIRKVEGLEMTTYYSANTQESTIYKDIIELCQQAVDRYPSYERINYFKNKIGSIQNPELQVSLPAVAYPGHEVKLGLNYKNVHSINIKVYETDLTPEEVNSYDYWTAQQKEKSKGNRKLVRQIRASLETPNTYQRVDTSIWITGLDEGGIYFYEITVPDKLLESTNYMFVSKVMAVSRSTSAGGADILVTDLYSGKPIEKGTVLLYSNKQNKPIIVDSLQTDLNGIARVPEKKDIRYFRAVYKGDTNTPLSSIYLGSSYSGGNTDTKTKVSLFTDRGLYRPGQNVYVKGIVYDSEKENQSVVANKTLTVILRDANHKEVATRDFTTNEFGSFHGEFTLPKYGLNGSFSLSAENETQYFRVEEYKRPTFNVEINSIKDEVAFGDTVTIKGKAQTFSGVPLQSGKVNYRVILRPFRFYSNSSYFQETQLLSGETQLDENGGFQFEFVPTKQEQLLGFPAYASYEVIATLSDSKGETQETNSSFSVGSSSIVLSTSLRDIMKKENLSVRINAHTLNGEPTKAEGIYRIYALKQERAKKGEDLKTIQGEEVISDKFTTESPINAKVFADLHSGNYRIRLEATDSKGRQVELEQDVILYTDKDKRPPVFSDIWITENSLSCLPGQEVQFVFGTSHKKAYVLYELYVNNKVVERKRMELSNENREIIVPFLEKYGDGAAALFTFIKEGKLYTRQVIINKQRPSKELTIKTETFRDKLIPGNKESWTFRVLNPDSLPAAAEVLASMYDASLDAIQPFNWNFSPITYPYIYASAFRNNGAYWFHVSSDYGKIDYKKVPEFEYSRFNWQQAMLTTYAFATRQSASLGAMKNQAVEMESDMVLTESVVEENASPVAPSPSNKELGAGEIKKETPLRQNFNETAFFYPVLRTDSEGNFTVNFTLPESNTTWKLQALAHTKDVKYGRFTKELISSKPLMVLPNLPRFVRQGDEVTISTQVINRSDDDLSGRVRLEIFDPKTEEPILCLSKSAYPFDLAAGKQTVASWTIPIVSGKDLLGVRIVADTETVSDGEQHLLPVLSNEVLLTESTPIYLKGEGEKEIHITKQNNTNDRPYKQTLEISANPIWYAVQALPNLSTPVNNSVSAWFASYYSNTLASSIVKANPRIKTVIDQWAAKKGDASSLLSNLEKNEELKNVILEETPWVLEAENETEQIQRLNLLFDMNRADGQRAQALQELIRLQREDGAWGWFSGFGADRIITVSILQGMADLVRLNAVQYGQEEKEMQMNALKFLDLQIQKDFELLKKVNKNWKNTTPSETQLAYILMRSSYRDIPEASETREAIRFYTDQAEKQWQKLPLRMKVQTALLLHRNRKKEQAQTIMNWFKRTATKSEEQGFFWANNRRNGFSPVSPIETHTLLMIAFAEINPIEAEVEGMKQWLLNQKRTQGWETTPATLNAIYALLLTGKGWLSENNQVTVTWGNETIDSKTGNVGIGYIKKSKNTSEIKAEDKVIVKKEGSAPAWGALYHQFFVLADQVMKSAGDLSIDKKLFVERVSSEGKTLVSIKDGENLRVGEKVVVRLTIRAKQEMTYVHLKDLRAGCFEPVEQVSGTQYRDGVSFYKTSKDASEHFFFDRLPEGTVVLEYGVYVSRSGEYASGPADIQCLYAPEYGSHTDGYCLIIKD